MWLAPRHRALTTAVSTLALAAWPLRPPMKETFSRGILTALDRVQEHTAGGFAPRPASSTGDRLPQLPHQLRPQAAQQTCNPVADYRCFNSSNVSIRPWSWNYRSCWHQTCPPVGTHHCVWIASITDSTSKRMPAELLQFVAASQDVFALGNLRACCPPW